MSWRRFRTERGRTLGAALGDQLLWSAAFFLFNAELGFGANKDYYAQVALATAISLIFLAAIRSWTIDSVLLFAPGNNRSTRVSVRLYSVAGIAAALTYAVWSNATLGALEPWVCVLAFAIVFGDSTRYTWTTQGLPERCLVLSGSYALSALVGLGLAAWLKGPNFVTACWTLALIGVGIVGLRGPLEPLTMRGAVRAVKRFRLALVLESIYFVGATQAGILALSFFGSTAAIGGLRLAYSVALAPATLLIQGMSSQVIRIIGSHQGNTSGIRFANRWGLASACLYFGNTAVIIAAQRAGMFASIDASVIFLAPLCALIMSQAVSNSLHAAFRYHVTVTMSQAVRITTLMSDTSVQVLGLAIFGTSGLVAGMYVAATLRCCSWALMLCWLRRRVSTSAQDGLVQSQ